MNIWTTQLDCIHLNMLKFMQFPGVFTKQIYMQVDQGTKSLESGEQARHLAIQAFIDIKQNNIMSKSAEQM